MIQLVALVIFFVSGCAALVYQVVWQRILVIFSGADIYSTTLIVAAFMAGLGLGSLAGGYVADRVPARRSLWLFVLAEGAVGLFAFGSKWFFYDLLYVRLSFLAGSGATGLVLFLSLLWPTFFMGMSLPLLARGLTSTVGTTGAVVGSLYGWNTAGAATGAIVSTWLLLPQLGLEGALRVGAVMNLGCAAAAALLVVGSRDALDRRVEPGVSAAPASGERLQLPFAAWATIYALTGFVALGLEIAWFRVLGVMVKSTAFTFGTLLAIYLGGLGLGAAVGARLVRRSTRPGATFLALQSATVIVAALLLTGLVTLVAAGQPPALATYVADGEPYDVYPGVAALRDFVRGERSDSQRSDLRQFLLLYLVMPISLIGIPTTLMGFSFPFLQQAAQADAAHIGRRVGALMAANIAGSAAGAAATGLVLLSWLGAAATLKLIVAAGAIPGLLLVARSTSNARRRVASGGLVLATILTIALMPDNRTLWAVLHGTTSDRVLVAEDGSGLSVIKATGSSFDEQTIVFVNGASQGRIPYGDTHTALGAIPTLLHPHPREVLIIGLGSGDTCFSAAGRPEVERLACVEIIGKQRDTLETLSRMAAKPGVDRVLTDRRIAHIVGDGRAYLLRNGRRFDVIEADALRPISAYSGNLYSLEYFELMRDHLKPGGMAVTWAPTDLVRDTFLRVFPYVVALDNHQIYVGSREPITVDRAAVERIAASPQVRAYFEAGGVNIVNLVQERFGREVATFGPNRESAEDARVNTDLFPRDEFRLPPFRP
jgi:spermidine synthase